MRTKLLKAKEAATLLNIPLTTFYENHVAMGLLPIDFGGQTVSKTLKDGTQVQVVTKQQLRWPEAEIERYVEKKLSERFRQSATVNSVLRMARTSKAGKA